jgi:hypothetical protein
MDYFDLSGFAITAVDPCPMNVLSRQQLLESHHSGCVNQTGRKETTYDIFG